MAFGEAFPRQPTLPGRLRWRPAQLRVKRKVEESRAVELKKHDRSRPHRIVGSLICCTVKPMCAYG
jgi:hypothetical protein